MGYVYLILSKLAAIGKIISVKKCGNIASGARNSLIINLLRSLGCLTVGAVVCIFSGFGKIDSAGLWISVASGLSNGVLLFSWILAASAAPLLTVEVFCMIGGVVIPLILSPIMLEGESVSILQWVGSLLLFAAMFCLSGKKGGGRLTPKGIFLMCLAGLANAGGVITQKLYNSLSVGTVADFQLGTYAVSAAVLGIALLIVSIFQRKSDTDSTAPKFSKHVVLFIGIAVVMMYISQFLSTLASGKLESAVFYPLAYVISMPLVFLVDVLVYKEKVTRYNIMGIIFVTASGILINL